MECQPRVLNAAHLSCFTKFLGEEAKFSGDCGVADWSQGLWHSARQAIRLAPSDLFAGWMSALLLSGKCWVLCLATLQVFCWVGLSGWHHQASSCSSSQIKGTGVVSENKTRLTCWRCLLVCYQDFKIQDVVFCRKHWPENSIGSSGWPGVCPWWCSALRTGELGISRGNHGR